MAQPPALPATPEITHAFVSTDPDTAVETDVQPSNWNAGHVIPPAVIKRLHLAADVQVAYSLVDALPDEDTGQQGDICLAFSTGNGAMGVIQKTATGWNNLLGVYSAGQSITDLDAWHGAGGHSLYAQDTQPTNPKTGDLWIDTSPEGG